MIMKPLSLIAICTFAASCANAELLETWTWGVSPQKGWYDANKTLAPGDDNLCWAASASNILNWWQDRYVIPSGTPTGEAVWTTFKDSFTDLGGNASYAFQWWLSGDYPPAGVEGWSRLKEGAAAGGYYRSIFSENQAVFLTSAYNATSYSASSQYILDRLNEGYGLTLSIGDTLGKTAHAITLWGVEYDDQTSLLTKMYLTDSDDLQYGYHSSNGMFEVACYTGENGGLYFQTTEDGWYQREDREFFIKGVYGLSTDVGNALALIPEPGTATLSLAALLCLAWKRRRQACRDRLSPYRGPAV